MDNETCLELESLIRDRTGLKTSRPIKPSNRLEDDLGLTGDEADDFMGKFFERFPVQPGDYAFTRYFSEEGFNLFEIVTMPFSKKKRQKYDKEALTVGMLERAIVLGVWDSKKIAN